jgi:hypothetical protein
MRFKIAEQRSKSLMELKRPVIKPSIMEHHEPMKGAGDFVKKVIDNTVMKVIPPSMAQMLQNCGGCAGRREWLNKHIPFNRKESSG